VKSKRASVALLLAVSSNEGSSLSRCLFIARRALESSIDRVVLLFAVAADAIIDDVARDPRISVFVPPEAEQPATGARLVNLAIHAIDVEFIWLHDARHLVCSCRVLEAMAHLDADLVAPVCRYVALSLADTRTILVNKINHIPSADCEAPISAPGKGSIIVRRDALLALRGLDERTIGDFEDFFELVRRARRLGLREVILEPQSGIRLFANRDAAACAAYRQRYELS
jgi:hypothetical protein